LRQEQEVCSFLKKKQKLFLSEVVPIRRCNGVTKQGKVFWFSFSKKNYFPDLPSRRRFAYTLPP